MNLLTKKSRKLRNLWWVAIFFIVLAAFTIPFVLVSKYYTWEITLTHQALIIICVSLICQLLKGDPLVEVIGNINIAWFKNLMKGLLTGALLMLAPAFFLYVGNWVSWESLPFNPRSLLSVTYLFVCVAVTEELLFRGFLFQQLVNSIGVWGTQLIISGYFLLTHMNNPGMAGNVKVFASINIFLASVTFGLAFIKTKSLAMPIGLHFMANWVQGVLLGFGVSGNEQSGFLKPVFNDASEWLTGGKFGLEASIPGLICIVICTIFLYYWNPKN